MGVAHGQSGWAVRSQPEVANEVEAQMRVRTWTGSFKFLCFFFTAAAHPLVTRCHGPPRAVSVVLCDFHRHGGGFVRRSSCRRSRTETASCSTSQQRHRVHCRRERLLLHQDPLSAGWWLDVRADALWIRHASTAISVVSAISVHQLTLHSTSWQLLHAGNTQRQSDCVGRGPARQLRRLHVDGPGDEAQHRQRPDLVRARRLPFRGLVSGGLSGSCRFRSRFLTPSGNPPLP